MPLQISRNPGHLRSVVPFYLSLLVSLLFVFTGRKNFQSMYIRRIFISLLVVLFPSSLLHAQWCSKGGESKTLPLKFKSTVLRRELIGFFPYPPAGGQNPNEPTTAKYLTET
jgi:hypothetical protein